MAGIHDDGNLGPKSGTRSQPSSELVTKVVNLFATPFQLTELEIHIETIVKHFCVDSMTYNMQDLLRGAIMRTIKNWLPSEATVTEKPLGEEDIS